MKQWLTSYKISLIATANLIYYGLMKIPIIGKRLSLVFYRKTTLKLVLSLGIRVIKNIFRLFFNVISPYYQLIIIWAYPFYRLGYLTDLDLLFEQGLPMLVPFIGFQVSIICISKATSASRVFTVTTHKTSLTRYFKVDIPHQLWGGVFFDLFNIILTSGLSLSFAGIMRWMSWSMIVVVLLTIVMVRCVSILFDFIVDLSLLHRVFRFFLIPTITLISLIYFSVQGNTLAEYGWLFYVFLGATFAFLLFFVGYLLRHKTTCREGLLKVYRLFLQSEYLTNSLEKSSTCTSK